MKWQNYEKDDDANSGGNIFRVQSGFMRQIWISLKCAHLQRGLAGRGLNHVSFSWAYERVLVWEWALDPLQWAYRGASSGHWLPTVGVRAAATNDP